MDWNGLRYWLDSHIEDVTGELAYRVAVRAFPLVSLDLHKTWSSKVANELRILGMLRALVTMRVALDRPDMDLSPYLQQARIRLAAPHTFDYAGRSTRSACNLLLLLTRRERSEELRKTIQTAKDGSQNVGQGDEQHPGPYRLNTWREVEADTRVISSGATLPEFAIRQPSAVAGAWRSLREYMFFYDESWAPWLDWLRFRMFGEVTEKISPAQWRVIELKLATAGDSMWGDSAQLNQFFIDTLADFEANDPADDAIEEQNPVAILFVADEQGRFDLDRSPIARGLPAPSDPLYLELLETASTVIVENTENSAAQLREKVERYRAALLALHESSGPAVLIVRGESLRILKCAYESSEDFLDLAALTEQARMRLDELVAQHNVMVGLNPGLAAVDRLVHPDQSDELLSSEDLRTIIETARKHSILTVDADSALSEVAHQVGENPKHVHKVRASESGKNLVRGAFRELLKFKRAIGIAVVSVPPALYGIGRWALANETVLTKYFHANPAMHEAIVRIFEWLHGLPLL